MATSFGRIRPFSSLQQIKQIKLMYYVINVTSRHNNKELTNKVLIIIMNKYFM